VSVRVTLTIAGSPVFPEAVTPLAEAAVVDDAELVGVAAAASEDASEVPSQSSSYKVAE